MSEKATRVAAMGEENVVRTTLLTGGCGFIGSHLAHRLRESSPDHALILLDRLTYAGSRENLDDLLDDSRVTLVEGDVADPRVVRAIFDSHDVERVLHLAAESHVDRSIASASDFVRTNVLGTQVLLEAARDAWGEKADRRDRRFLHVSTDEVFGSIAAPGRFDESSPFAPRSPYAASKAAADHLVAAFHHTFDLPTLITHSTNNYGPRQFPEKLIPVVIESARSGRAVPVYGDGLQVRDWIAVEDHAAALLAILERGTPGESYAVGAGEEHTNLELVEQICDHLDVRLGAPPEGPRRTLITHVTDRLGHDRRYAIDSSKVRHELGWSPTIEFDAGIAATVDWYLEREEWVARALARLPRERKGSV